MFAGNRKTFTNMKNKSWLSIEKIFINARKTLLNNAQVNRLVGIFWVSYFILNSSCKRKLFYSKMTCKDFSLT